MDIQLFYYLLALFLGAILTISFALYLIQRQSREAFSQYKLGKTIIFEADDLIIHITRKTKLPTAKSGDEVCKEDAFPKLSPSEW